MKKLIGLTLMCLLVHSVSFAGNYTWTGTTNTNWGTSTNWSPNGVPGSSDSISISTTTNSLTLTANQTIKRLTMNSGILDLGGDTLTITGSSGLHGGNINNGHFKTQTSGLIYFHGTSFGAEVSAVGQIKLDGSVFDSTAYFEHNSSASGTGAGGNTFNGVTTLKNAGTTTFRTAGTNSDTFNNNVFLISASSAGSSNFQMSYGAATYFNGNIEVSSSSTFGISFSSAGNGSSTLASGKTITIGSGGFTGTLLIKNFTQTGSTSQSLSLSGVLNIANSTFNGSFTSSSSSILLSGCNFNNQASFTKTGTANDFSAGGNYFANTTTFTNSSSTTAKIRLAATSGDSFVGATTFNTTNGLIEVAYVDTTEFQGDVSINNSKVTFNNSTGYVLCIGGTSQEFDGSADYAIGKLIINKSANELTLQRAAIIDSSLKFTNGIIFTDSINLLTLKAGSSWSGASSSSYVDGPVKKIGNTSFVFPLGKNAVYLPLEISAPSSSTNAYVSEYIDSNQPYGTVLDTGLKYLDNCQYWNLYRTSGSSTVTVNLYFNEFGCEILDSASLRFVNWDGSKWRNLDNGGITGNLSSGKIVNSLAVASYGHFGLGYALCQMDAYTIALGDSAKARTYNGISPYTYLWSTAATDSFITGISAGTAYVVTVTDYKGCTATANFSRIFSKLTTGPIVNEGNNSYYASWGDYDNDYDLDLFHSLFFAAPNNTSGNNFLLQNNCNGGLTKVQSIPGGLVSDGLTGTFSKWVDYDNDGDRDLYVGPGILYENGGDGSFSIVDNQITNLPTYTTAVRDGGFADYDNDGLLDVYFGHTKIYNNDGDKDFSEITVSAFSGIASADRCDAIAWADFDNDGYMDVLVTNSNSGVGNYLFHNEGDGTFTSVTSCSELIQSSQNSYGCAWGDIDNDLDLDLWLNNNATGDRIFLNNGSGGFSLVSKNIYTDGIAKQAGTSWADYDNDGDLDLFVPTFEKNYLFINDGLGNFIKDSIEIVSSDTELESFAGAYADYDNDGDLDLFVPTAFTSHPNDLFYTNTLDPKLNPNHNFVKLTCIGESTNKDAVGVRVYVKATIGGSSKWQMREINGNSMRSGESGALSSNVVHFGLGNATSIDSLKIYWPVTEETQVFTNVDVNEYYKVVEDSDTMIVMVNCKPDLPADDLKVISGRVYSDEDSDCVYDPADNPIANVFVKASPGNYYTLTNDTGYYFLKVPDGSYDVDANFIDNNWNLQSCTSDSVYSVSTIGVDTVALIDFAQSRQIIPCDNEYVLFIERHSIDPGDCPSGLLKRGPCPGFRFNYCFSVQNNSTFNSGTNTVIHIELPTLYSILSVMSNSAAYSITPTLPTSNIVDVTIPGFIGSNGSIFEICLEVSINSSALISTISMDYQNSSGPPTNLVVNGDFDACSTAVSCNFTTGYTNNCLAGSGRFCILNDANSIHSSWNGTAWTNPNMMVVDGSIVPGTDVWCQQINVDANTQYAVQYALQNVNPNGVVNGMDEPIVDFLINGIVENSVGPVLSQSGWNFYSFLWCSELLTGNIPFCFQVSPLTNSPNGNDFGIDNIEVFENWLPPFYLNEIEDCSCDPNNLVVSPTGCGIDGNVLKNQEFSYLINFHNIGSGNAHNVYIVDKLDQDLDLTTLRIKSSSHNITDVAINPDQTLLVKFDDIELEPDSVGHISFTVSPFVDLDDGTVILNQAGIYFDNNEVVLTNVTRNTLYEIPTPSAEFEYSRNCSNSDIAYDFFYNGNTSDNASFSWTFEDGTPATSTGQNPSNIEFSSEGSKVVTLEVSRFGCTSFYMDTIEVTSVLNSNKDSIYICHDGELILIDLDSLHNHLLHDDCVGECDEETESRIMFVKNENDFNFSISPNPSSGNFKVNIDYDGEKPRFVDFKVYNSMGIIVSLQYKEISDNNNTMNYEFNTDLGSGVYIVHVNFGDIIKTLKLVIR